MKFTDASELRQNFQGGMIVILTGGLMVLGPTQGDEKHR